MENVQLVKEIYGYMHARYIKTGKGIHSVYPGLALMREKHLNGVYGHCPRILCDKQIMIPIGLSDQLKYSRVKVIKYRINRSSALDVKMSINLVKNVATLTAPTSGILFLSVCYWYKLLK